MLAGTGGCWGLYPGGGPGQLGSDPVKEMAALSRPGLGVSATQVGDCLTCSWSVFTPAFVFHLSGKELAKDGVVVCILGRVGHGALSHSPVSELPNPL